MKPPDITNEPAKWEKVRDSEDHPLWRHREYPDIFSTDGGATFTISTERVDPLIPRPVRESRKM